ncbi:MAG: HlyD family efflux transporter periplasmic adaptor subunit [Dysgonomonas sp.]|nr:HlyD family efflux transporter periplasmic adaptor subunit [Dysgonomonas sp.]
MKQIFVLSIITVLLSTACNRNKFLHDASGTFEATEIIISAEASGKIEEFNVTEGDILSKGQYLGYIDTTQLYLKKLQLQTTTKAVSARRPDISLQIASTKEQIANTKKDKERIENMLKDGAATRKQMDDVNTQLQVLERNLAAQLNTLTTSNNSLDKESATYEIQVAQIEDQLKKSYLINPVEGTVLNKYAETNEIATLGKPLYKIADTKNLFLRAYVTASQLNNIKIGQEVTVFINSTDDSQKSYKGSISWIADKAEFTPKTIQTQDERQNLVYAVKIAVANTDGLIKIGMYGDVDFKSE